MEFRAQLLREAFPAKAAVRYKKLARIVTTFPQTGGQSEEPAISYARRFHPVLKRIDDQRRFILYEQGWAAWRAPRGYVENVAAALALCVVNEQASGRIYNVAESPAYSELEWARKIAVATGWTGEFVVLPDEGTPKHLKPPGNTAQHWELDSTRIRRELGYHEIISLDEAIRRTIGWERANPPGEINPHPFDYAAEDAAIASQYRAEPQ